MLYDLHELGRAAIEPWRWVAEAGEWLCTTPYSPLAYTPGGRAVAAACNIFESTTRRYGKPRFGLDVTQIDGRDIPVVEKILLRKSFGQLKQFERQTDDPAILGQPKLLIVAPLSGHYATLLRGTVEAMLPYMNVYITDWRDARLVPLADGHFDLDDCLDYLTDFIHCIGPDTHVLAVCQPAPATMAAVSLMSAAKDPMAPRSMTLMGGPIDTRICPTVPNRLATERPIEWFESNVISRVPALYPGFLRPVYPGFLQLTGFMTMNLDRHMDAHWKLFRHLTEGDGDSAAKHNEFYDEYRSVMDLDAPFYLQTIQTVFQDHNLPLGTWVSRGRKVDPGAITKTAVLTVEGEKDDISAPGQTRAAHDLCRNLSASQQETWLQPGVGHYGVFNGSRWRKEIAPRVRAFIHKHNA